MVFIVFTLGLRLFLSFQTVKIVNPIRFQEVDQKENRTERPANGIGPRNGGKHRIDLHRYGDIAHTNQAPAGQHGKHRLAR